MPETGYVLESCSLLDFINHILDHTAASSWLLICASRDAFSARVVEMLSEKPDLNAGCQDIETKDHHRVLDARLTLRLLALSQTIQVAFVPDVAHLRAKLASIGSRRCLGTDEAVSEDQRQHNRPKVAILDLIRAHHSSSAFSVQSISRTLALAVDVAHARDSTLVICETENAGPAELLAEPEGTQQDQTLAKNPWDADIRIIDGRTKTFGPGSRGWTGRTVKLRRVAERWLVFRTAQT